MQWKSYFWPWNSVANLKVELLNGEQKKIMFYAMEKVSFCSWHSVANLKVELLNGEQKYYVLCDGKVFFGLALCCQPESTP
jgi:hypothetical protein